MSRMFTDETRRQFDELTPITLDDEEIEGDADSSNEEDEDEEATEVADEEVA